MFYLADHFTNFNYRIFYDHLTFYSISGQYFSYILDPPAPPKAFFGISFSRGILTFQHLWGKMRRVVFIVVKYAVKTTKVQKHWESMCVNTLIYLITIAVGVENHFIVEAIFVITWNLFVHLKICSTIWGHFWMWFYCKNTWKFSAPSEEISKCRSIVKTKIKGIQKFSWMFGHKT